MNVTIFGLVIGIAGGEGVGVANIVGYIAWNVALQAG